MFLNIPSRHLNDAVSLKESFLQPRTSFPQAENLSCSSGARSADKIADTLFFNSGEPAQRVFRIDFCNGKTGN